MWVALPASLCQDGVDAESLFDSSDLDARAQRADALEKAWGRISMNYQQSMDLEGLADVAPQVTWPDVSRSDWGGHICRR